MDTILVPSHRRRIVRRAWDGRCHAISLRDFRMIGQRVLDISPYGLLVAADTPVEPGERVMVSFQAPGDTEWFDAEARVARVIEGWREGDPGYCMGLRFTHIPLERRLELRARLHGLPPPLPRRRLRMDYAESVRRILSN
ncbi:MAG: PilZ domain-containing protein [Myxococcota bacterium]